MAYNDFTLEALKQQFGLQTDEEREEFAQVEPVPISDTLRSHLRKYVPRAIAIGTEKARSELIITPVLLEVMEQFHQQISFFSGIEFNVDPDRGLRGVCDYLFSLSPEQFAVEAPVVTVVEAKNENLRLGVNQCIAEMVAAQTFNRAKGNALETVYGTVTTGSTWLFMQLTDATVAIDRSEYYIREAERIVGILLSMLRASSEQMKPSG
jgi:hypothetical protein